MTSRSVFVSPHAQNPSSDEEQAQITASLLDEAAHAKGTRRDELLQEVVLVNLGTADRAARRYRNRGVADEDLVQVARLGLVKAAYGFDPAKGSTFLGYAMPTVLGEIRRYFRDKAWLVRPPRRVQELQAEVNGCAEDCAQQNGHTATADELADATGHGRTEVLEALAADGCFSPRSLDWLSEDGFKLGDAIGREESGYGHAEARQTLKAAIKQLPARDRRLIYLRFFEERTQAEIAKEFGVTQMQISRLLKRVLGRMREDLAAA
jgi:RNA polymerase sigma-B factor